MTMPKPITFADHLDGALVVVVHTADDRYRRRTFEVSLPARTDAAA